MEVFCKNSEQILTAIFAKKLLLGLKQVSDVSQFRKVIINNVKQKQPNPLKEKLNIHKVIASIRSKTFSNYNKKTICVAMICSSLASL